MPLKRSGSLREFAVREATAVAAERSAAKQRAASTSEYCKAAMDAIEFQILSLQAEKKILSQLSEMSEGDALSTVFQMMDKECNGFLNSIEIKDGLQNTHGTYEYERQIETVANEVFPGNDNKRLSYNDFRDTIQVLQDKLECSLLDIAQLLIVQVAFSNTSQSVDKAINPTLSTMDLSSLSEEDRNFEKLLQDKRLKVLFNLFDDTQSGNISFKEVVLGLYKMTENLDKVSKVASSALLMFKDKQRTLDFEGFANLIVNFLAATSNASFDYVADSMTRHAAEPLDVNIEQMAHLFAMDAGLKTLLDLPDEESKIDVNLSEAELAKLDRLFNMWDQDKDDFISFHELALGIRKFQETTQLKDTVSESLQVLNAFDLDHDRKLNRKEFNGFVNKFSEMVESDISGLADFMIVAAALKENSESETAYITGIKESDIYYWGC